MGCGGAHGANNMGLKGISVYSCRSPILQTLTPMPEKIVSDPTATVVTAGWVGDLQRSSITILKKGGPIPAGGEGASDK